MTPEERAAFQAEVKAYLLENPEVLVEAMGILQEREYAAELARDSEIITAQSSEIFASPNDWVGGNPEGDITLVEFMDYRCSYCRKAHDEVQALIRTDGNIRFILKEFPILGPESLVPSQFAIAVRMLYGDDAYKALKTALDGGLARRADNVLIYATSNRRHLMPERMQDNLDSRNVNGEIHPGEAVEEKVSLSERFGLWLSFYPFDQDTYLAAVAVWLAHHQLKLTPRAERAALLWALTRGARSGRVAWQFACDWAGRTPAERKAD
ncbi:MAG: hypothetical protein B7Z10_10010 [Rhodobacterales bacterium 32-66-7]|nr:MAG: hypothetical protein B7Z10_10010 [Rhodobacterales bacterium 32-66-7]